MKIFETGTIMHLQGHLTGSGVTTRRVEALDIFLQRMESAGKKNIRIDCGRILRADVNGLQLLYVWIQCAGFEGLEVELVNLSCRLQVIMRKLGLWHCFAGNMV